MSQKEVICFDVSKNEKFQISDNYKILHRKIKTQWTVEQNDVDLKHDLFQRINVLVLAGPQERFTEEEFEALKQFISSGGKLLVVLGKGGEQEYDTNINFYLEQYGIFINNDSVVRPQYYKSFHPEDCIVSGGITNESMVRFLLSKEIDQIDFDFSEEKHKILFQYPYGSTLNVSGPAKILFTTGPVAYPFNRPLASIYMEPNGHGGKILVIGSGYIWHDKYIQTNKTNDLMLDYCLQLLSADDKFTGNTDYADVDVSDIKTFTNFGFVVDLPKACLIDFIGTDNATVTQDIKQKFDMKLCMISNRLLTDVIAAYKQLRVNYEPLKIIKPNFEIPLPPLQLTTFSPIFFEPPAAQLELFDLDVVFNSPRIQLSQLAGKCLQSLQLKSNPKPLSERDLKSFIRECGRITGITTDHQQQNLISEADILNIAVERILTYKPIDNEK